MSVSVCLCVGWLVCQDYPKSTERISMKLGWRMENRPHCFETRSRINALIQGIFSLFFYIYITAGIYKRLEVGPCTRYALHWFNSSSLQKYTTLPSSIVAMKQLQTTSSVLKMAKRFRVVRNLSLLWGLADIPTENIFPCVLSSASWDMKWIQ